jgi:hypothetical protein
MKKQFGILAVLALVALAVGPVARGSTPRLNVSSSPHRSLTSRAPAMICEEPNYGAPPILEWDPFHCVWLRADGTAVQNTDWPSPPGDVIFKPAGQGASYSRYMLISG